MQSFTFYTVNILKSTLSRRLCVMSMAPPPPRPPTGSPVTYLDIFDSSSLNIDPHKLGMVLNERGDFCH